MAKRDARFLSPEAQAEVRLRVLNALQDGMNQAQAAQTFGVSRWSVVHWAKAHRQAGEQALAPKRRGRRTGEAGKLSTKQCERMRTGGGQDARPIEAAVLLVDARGGARTDQARMRGEPVADRGGRLSEALGAERAAPGQASL